MIADIDFKGVVKKALLQDLNDIKSAVDRNHRSQPDKGMPRTALHAAADALFIRLTDVSLA